jgi:hypothetical protein
MGQTRPAMEADINITTHSQLLSHQNSCMGVSASYRYTWKAAHDVKFFLWPYLSLPPTIVVSAPAFSIKNKGGIP